MSLINGKDEMTKNHDYLNVLFDSAFLVVIVTSCLYLFGYGYYKSFFDGLSIPTKFLEISPVHYFIKSFDVIIIFSIVFTIALLLYSFNIYLSSKINIPKLIFYFLLILSLSISLLIIPLLSFDMRLNILAMIVLAVPFLISINKFHFGDTYAKLLKELKNIIEAENINKFIYSVILLLFVLFYSSTFGFNDAANFTHGNSPDALEIQLNLKDKNDTELQNKTLLLVMMHQNKYYIVEKNINGSDSNLYIIPVDQVERATILKKRVFKLN